MLEFHWSSPQALKRNVFSSLNGTTEVVPFLVLHPATVLVRLGTAAEAGLLPCRATARLIQKP
jgi:hypothetical protein